VQALERYRAVPYNSADEVRSTPLGPGLSLFLALESRKTLYLNCVFKVTTVDLVPFLIRCRLWLGLLPGHTSLGLSEGGNPRGRVPARPLGTLGIVGGAFSPLRAAGITLSKRSTERWHTWKVLLSRRRASSARDA
jgi:hypothetical protein